MFECVVVVSDAVRTEEGLFEVADQEDGYGDREVYTFEVPEGSPEWIIEAVGQAILFRLQWVLDPHVCYWIGTTEEFHERNNVPSPVVPPPPGHTPLV